MITRPLCNKVYLKFSRENISTARGIENNAGGNKKKNVQERILKIKYT